MLLQVISGRSPSSYFLEEGILSYLDKDRSRNPLMMEGTRDMFFWKSELDERRLITCVQEILWTPELV